MLPHPEPATFLIADISGYTRFLASTEIAHAQDIIADFLNAVTEALAPTFRLAKYEGDAVFVVAAGLPPDASLLEDIAEGAYFAFRRRQQTVRQATSCTCAACARMGDLDLKIVVHSGEMVRQRLGGHEELAGRDVIVVHRLLKNAVIETFGLAAYVLYTAPCLASVEDPGRQGLLRHMETDESLGAIPVWYRDLAAAWSAQSRRSHRHVAAADAFLSWEFPIPASPRQVWEMLTVPGLWQSWWHAEKITEVSGNGRRGEGTQNHCAHGGQVVIEEIIDWHPFDYFTIGITVPSPGAPLIVMTREVVADGSGGTMLSMRVERPAPADEAFVRKAAAGFTTNVTPAIARLVAQIAVTAP